MFRESCFSLISWSQRTPHSLNEKPPSLDCAINVRAPQHCIITAITLPLKTHNLPGDKNDQFIWVNNTSLLKMWIAPKLKRLGNKWLEDNQIIKESVNPNYYCYNSNANSIKMNKNVLEKKLSFLIPCVSIVS